MQLHKATMNKSGHC